MRRRRFDEGRATGAAITVGLVSVGALLIGLGWLIRSVDDHLAEFEDPGQEATQ